MIVRRTLLTALPLLPVPILPGWAASVTLKAADGVNIAADAARAKEPGRGTILLFHMAGANYAEYAPIAPRLNEAGFDTLAIDQRSGGTEFGRRNETAAQIARDPGFAAALPDLEAALAEARRTHPGKPVLVWGSSYSAALVFVLAARHPAEVAAVLAFSPGEYIEGVSIRDAAAKLTCPIFVTSASDPGEEAAAARILAAAPSRQKSQFRAASGLHGSSTLRPENHAGAEQTWRAVMTFLNQVVPARP